MENNNQKNEIGLAVGDQLLRRKNGRVSLVAVHRVTKTRAFVMLPNYFGTKANKQFANGANISTAIIPQAI